MHGYGGGTDTQLTMFTAARVYTAWEGRFRSIWTGHISPPEWEMFEGAALFHAMFINREIRPYLLRPLRLLKKPDILGSIRRCTIMEKLLLNIVFTISDCN